MLILLFENLLYLIIFYHLMSRLILKIVVLKFMYVYIYNTNLGVNSKGIQSEHGNLMFLFCFNYIYITF